MGESCVFCLSPTVGINWSFRKVMWRGVRNFEYCHRCDGYTLSPKLAEEELDLLYSDYYLSESELLPGANNPIHDMSDFRKYHSTETYLSSNPCFGKSFLDYGCGVDAIGIKLALSLGLYAHGMEVSSKTREILKKIVSVPIYSPNELVQTRTKFDIILISDVLEHVSNPAIILHEVRELLAENGILIIQGPLEGATSLTNLLIKMYTFITPNKVSRILPYHVSLGTLKSYATLLELTDFNLVTTKVHETWWPVQNVFGNFHPNPRYLLQVVAKLFDFAISFCIKNYGSRFWLVAIARKI